MREQDLHIAIDRRGEVVVLRLDGSAGLVSAPQLDRAVVSVLALRPTRVVVDARRLEFITSLGIGALFGLAKGLAAWGGGMSLEGVPSEVRQVLMRCGVDRLFPVREALDPAFA
jgi:anti-sigma B factor antagonist